MLSSGCLTQFDGGLQAFGLTYCLQITALIELDGAPSCGLGAGDGARTRDLLLGKLALCASDCREERFGAHVGQLEPKGAHLSDLVHFFGECDLLMPSGPP